MDTISALKAAETIRSWNVDLSVAEPARRRFRVPELASRQVWFCRFVESSLHPWNRCLLWIAEWGVWESSENMPLYYRLRQSYGSTTEISSEPAHLFLESESPDLVNFLQLGFSAGWDFWVVPDQGLRRVFVSHDEWIEFHMRDKAGLEDISASLAKSGVEPIGHAV
jgi:hypothetical protein